MPWAALFTSGLVFATNTQQSVSQPLVVVDLAAVNDPVVSVLLGGGPDPLRADPASGSVMRCSLMHSPEVMCRDALLLLLGPVVGQVWHHSGAV